MHRLVLLVTNDIAADQRLHRTALTLSEAGYKVTAVGRRLKHTPKKIQRPYSVKLFRLPFKKGPLFYAAYNIYAFFYLIFHKYNLVQANDLDTLLAARLAAFIKRKPLVYDSHELFTEVPELVYRPKVKRVWLWLERRLVPGLRFCSTVSDGLSNELYIRYGKKFTLIRNLPLSKKKVEEYNPNGRIIIYQGALNVGRGLERLIKAMQYVSDATLQIVGSGDIADKLVSLTQKYNVENVVSFYGRLPLEELHTITSKATIGVSLEEDMGLNYRFALPNKLFDYIQAGLPVMVSNLPEMKGVVDDYDIGVSVSGDSNAYALAIQINKMLDSKKKLEKWHLNALKASDELVWEKEKIKLINLFDKALLNTNT
ncbi:MAG: glycosyltransferase [Bacteroidales bacterium]